MSCACGHDHAPAPRAAASEGTAVAMDRPMVALEGHLACADRAQMLTALSLLPDHTRLSRAEPGCLQFEVTQDAANPMIWHLSELFADADAFAAHQARSRASTWGEGSAGLTRVIDRREATAVLRPEIAADHAAIDALLQAAFGGRTEARLVRALRDDGDLALSLLAEARGVVLGHAVLTPLAAASPAYALAPLAVAPRMQGRGLGAALIREALAWADGHPVVVLGDPAYYSSFGFVPADLASPYAGPGLQIHGHLPAGSPVGHARAFAAM